MSYQSVTYYWAVCNLCGRSINAGNADSITGSDEAAEAWGWRVLVEPGRLGKHVCDECIRDNKGEERT